MVSRKLLIVHYKYYFFIFCKIINPLYSFLYVKPWLPRASGMSAVRHFEFRMEFRHISSEEVSFSHICCTKTVLLLLKHIYYTNKIFVHLRIDEIWEHSTISIFKSIWLMTMHDHDGNNHQIQTCISQDFWTDLSEWLGSVGMSDLCLGPEVNFRKPDRKYSVLFLKSLIFSVF